MERVAAPDPRTQLVAWLDVAGRLCATAGDFFLEGSPPFGAATPSFAPWPCSSCDLWECNSGPTHAVWVRRAGTQVLWLFPHGDRVVTFDAARYEAAFEVVGATECWRDLPVLGPDDADRYDRWLDLDAIAARSPTLDVAFDIAVRVPERDAFDFELVAPPAEAIAIDDAAYFARLDGRWCAYLPDVFGLPSWFASDVVDDLAAALGLGR